MYTWSNLNVIVRVHLSVYSRLKGIRAQAQRSINGENTEQMYSKHRSLYSCLERQSSVLYTPQYSHTPVYWLSSWNRNSNFQIDWAKNILDSNLVHISALFRCISSIVVLNISLSGLFYTWAALKWKKNTQTSTSTCLMTVTTLSAKHLACWRW